MLVIFMLLIIVILILLSLKKVSRQQYVHDTSKEELPPLPGTDNASISKAHQPKKVNGCSRPLLNRSSFVKSSLPVTRRLGHRSSSKK